MISRPRVGLRPAPRAAAIAGLVLAAAAFAAPASAAGNTSATDENWLVAAHQTNLAEIAAGRDANRYASGRNVRGFAEDLVEDHTERDAQVVALARKYDVFLPKAPTDVQAQALAALQGKEGEAYDAAWVRDRIASHRAAQNVNQRELTSGEASDVRSAARDARETESNHLEELNDLAVDLGIARAPTEVSGGTGGQAAAQLSTSRRLPATILATIGVGLLAAELVLARRRRKAAT
jgi:putative membrane protein